MPLRDILNITAKAQGVNIADPNLRADLIQRVNLAAKELYDCWELPASKREQFFTFDITSRFVTLPPTVDKVIGMRWQLSGLRVNLTSRAPRYQQSPWRQPLLNFRIHGFTPLARSQTSAGPLTFTLAAAETAQFTVTVTGRTTTASRAVETLTFPPGTLSLTTVNNWQPSENSLNGIESISKSATTVNDITITEVGNADPIGVILNYLHDARYLLIQISDYMTGYTFSPGENTVECLYKHVFIPMVNDGDDFCGDPRLDIAVAWKVRANWYGEGAPDSPESAQASLTAAQNALEEVNAIMSKVCAEIDADQDKLIQTVRPEYELGPSSWRYFFGIPQFPLNR